MCSSDPGIFVPPGGCILAAKPKQFIVRASLDSMASSSTSNRPILAIVESRWAIAITVLPSISEQRPGTFCNMKYREYYREYTRDTCACTFPGPSRGLILCLIFCCRVSGGSVTVQGESGQKWDHGSPCKRTIFSFPAALSARRLTFRHSLTRVAISGISQCRISISPAPASSP